ncbi:MAG: tetratricopeptide repeat protein, partial [Candidatus Zipacnadales bacterium]
MKSRCRLFVLALLVLSGTIETGAEIERLKPFPAYYPSPADQAAAQRALRSAAEHLAGGHFGEAEQAVREAARLLPTAAVPFVMLGMIAEQQGRTTEAIEFYREALAWEPNESQALSALERLGAPSYENPVSQYEDQLVQLINAERRTAGLPTLKPHPVLAEVARAFSASMRDEGFFAHRSPLPGQTTALDRF